MKNWLLAMVIVISGTVAFAQQDKANVPATREDVQRYLEVMHSRDMMTKMADAMSKPLHQMVHDMYLKDQDKLPPDFKARMNRMLDDMWKTMPWDEMLEAMIPAYQKHLTKGDIDALIAFYSSATGQKLIREMPTMTADAMQDMLPIMRREMERMQERVRQETADLIRESQQPRKSPVTRN